MKAALLAGAAFLSSVFPLADACAERALPAGNPPVEILAPAEGATVPPGKVLVIGRAKPGTASVVEIDVNGAVHQKAIAGNGGFMASVYLTRGRNVLTIHADGMRAERRVVASETVTYRYHPEAEKCGGCHAEVSRGYVVSGRKDSICYQCHDRKDGKRLVHGPLGGGDCTICHDPHGASNPALTVANAEGLCVMCHDQPSSGRHLRESRAVGCVTCHEPHSSGKEYLQK